MTNAPLKLPSRKEFLESFFVGTPEDYRQHTLNMMESKKVELACFYPRRNSRAVADKMFLLNKVYDWFSERVNPTQCEHSGVKIDD